MSLCKEFSSLLPYLQSVRKLESYLSFDVSFPKNWKLLKKYVDEEKVMEQPSKIDNERMFSFVTEITEESVGLIVQNIKGIHEAHKAAAKKSFTHMFWVVDADAEILESFNIAPECIEDDHLIPYQNIGDWQNIPWHDNYNEPRYFQQGYIMPVDDCRVEGSDSESSRLLLCECSSLVLKQGLEILGLKTKIKI